MDTKFFLIAVQEWCKKNKWNQDLPITPAWLSQMLERAQQLKDAERQRVEQAAQS